MAEGREVTIYDIAKQLNISAATVSRGLKNNPMIKKSTRKKIMETAKLLGYQTNNFASSLRSRQTNTFGVLVPRLNSYFVSAVLAGMENAANKFGYNLIIAQSLEDAEREKANAASLFNKRVDGLLVSLTNNTQDIEHLQPFFRRKIPVVFFDRVHAHDDSTSVVIDNFAAGYQATTHLIEQGFKHIMHLGGSMLRNVYKDRFEGYRRALADHGIEFQEYLHLSTPFSDSSGGEAAQYILQLPLEKRPDAVFAAHDTSAVNCMIALKAAGLRIPEDIAFVGFNNDPISKVIEPNLTTVDYNGAVMGDTAMMNLINHIKGVSNLYTTNSIMLRAELVIRASSQKIQP